METVKTLLLVCLLVSCTGKRESKVNVPVTSFIRLEVGIEVYRDTCGFFPVTLMEIVEPKHCEKWKGHELEMEAIHDIWGRVYKYEFPLSERVCFMRTDSAFLETFPKTRRACLDYKLYSYGKDGKNGTEDDVANWMNIDDWYGYYTAHGW